MAFVRGKRVKSSVRYLPAIAGLLCSTAVLADAPYFGPRVAILVQPGQAVNQDVTPVDPDGDYMNVVAAGLPPGMTLTQTWDVSRFSGAGMDADGSTNPAASYGARIDDLESLPNDGIFAVTRDTVTFLTPAGDATRIVNPTPSPIFPGAALWSPMAGYPSATRYFQEISPLGTAIAYVRSRYGIEGLFQTANGWTFTNMNVVSPANGNTTGLDMGLAALDDANASQLGFIFMASPQLAMATPGNAAVNLQSSTNTTAMCRTPNGSVYAEVDPATGPRTLNLISSPAALVDSSPQQIQSQVIASFPSAEIVDLECLPNGNVLLVFEGSTLNVLEIDPAGNQFLRYRQANNYSRGVARLPGSTDILVAVSYLGNVIPGTPNQHGIVRVGAPHWAITGAYTGPACGGEWTVMIDVTDQNGETAQTSLDITVPPQGPGCSGPPGGPSGAGSGIGNTGSGPGSRPVGTGTPVPRPNSAINLPRQSSAPPPTARSVPVRSVRPGRPVELVGVSNRED